MAPRGPKGSTDLSARLLAAFADGRPVFDGAFLQSIRSLSC